MSIEKPIYDKRDLKRLNGNVIDITPLLKDEWWKIKEEETNGKEETKKRKEIKVVSAPDPDDAWFGLWENLSGQGIVPRGIETLIDFKRWFYKQDLDVEMFSQGGLASLI